MIEKDTTTLKQYTTPLSRSIQEQYAISPDHYRGDVKLGLRNSKHIVSPDAAAT